MTYYLNERGKRNRKGGQKITNRKGWERVNMRYDPKARAGAAIIWKLVCKKWNGILSCHVQTSLWKMTFSLSGLDWARSIGGKVIASDYQRNAPDVQHSDFDKALLRAVAKKGSPELMRTLQKSTYIMQEVGGNLASLPEQAKWFRSWPYFTGLMDPDGDSSTELLNHAVATGNGRMIDFLMYTGYQVDEQGFLYAAKNGCFKTLAHFSSLLIMKARSPHNIVHSDPLTTDDDGHVNYFFLDQIKGFPLFDSNFGGISRVKRLLIKYRHRKCYDMICEKEAEYAQALEASY